MGRLKAELLVRTESFCDRGLDVVAAMEARGVSRRILEQLTGSGTAVGANLFEADETMSRADFCKCLAIAIKELNETRFWLRLAVRRGWLAGAALVSLQGETLELKRILGSVVSRTRSSKVASTTTTS